MRYIVCRYICLCSFSRVCVSVFLLKCCWCDTFITGDINELNSSCGRAQGERIGVNCGEKKTCKEMEEKGKEANVQTGVK